MLLKCCLSLYLILLVRHIESAVMNFVNLTSKFAEVPAEHVQTFSKRYFFDLTVNIVAESMPVC